MRIKLPSDYPGNTSMIQIAHEFFIDLGKAVGLSAQHQETLAKPDVSSLLQGVLDTCGDFKSHSAQYGARATRSYRAGIALGEKILEVNRLEAVEFTRGLRDIALGLPSEEGEAYRFAIWCVANRAKMS
jgi:hypothetical protein